MLSPNWIGFDFTHVAFHINVELGFEEVPLHNITFFFCSRLKEEEERLINNKNRQRDEIKRIDDEV